MKREGDNGEIQSLEVNGKIPSAISRLWVRLSEEVRMTGKEDNLSSWVSCGPKGYNRMSDMPEKRRL